MPIHQTARTFGARRVPTLADASGCWQLGEVTQARRDGIWPGTSDPLFSEVTLLLAMDGTNGSTTFIDDSNSSLSFTASGNAQISTAESKFGGASGLFDGTGDYIQSDTTTGAMQFGTGDFTVEAWVYLDSTASEGVIQQTPTTDPSCYCSIDSTAVRVGRHGAGQYSGASNTLSIATWHHVAWVRESGTVYIFFDGVSQSVSDASGGVGSYDFSSERTVVVGRAGALDFDGNIDSLRVTKAARYTANFTPPSGAFPTS